MKRSIRYSNIILTVIAVLLSLHLWTLWTAGPAGPPVSLASPAEAAARPVGLPNAAGQRAEIIKHLKAQTRKTDELIKLFKSGNAKVKATMPKQKVDRN